MSNNEKDKLFNAYLDGQLSAAEAASFDEMFSAAEKVRIEAEVKLEAALGETLHGGITCPDHVWKRTQLMLNNQAPAPTRNRLFPLVRMAVGAAAALLIFTVGAFFLNQYTPEGDLFSVSAATVEEFAAMAEVTGDHDALCAYLREQGWHLTLNTPENVNKNSPHALSILGICKGDCGGIAVKQVLIDCCNVPTKIIIAPANSEAARMMDVMKAEGKVQETRLIGNYYACVIGAHPSAALDFLSEIH